MVPASPSSAASPPRAVELDGVPVAQAVVTKGIRSQVTDLQAGKLSQELLEGQPTGKNTVVRNAQPSENYSLYCIRLTMARGFQKHVHLIRGPILDPKSSPKLPVLHLKMQVLSLRRVDLVPL